MAWWHVFLQSWNGLSLLHSVTTPTFTIYTNASGSWGCGACFGKRWLQWQWPNQWSPVSIMAKELVPIILSCAVWGPHLVRHTVLFHCDNSSVVAAIKKGAAKEPIVINLLRCLWFFTAYFNISLLCEHIAGVTNELADYISRGNLTSFFNYNPQAYPTPTSVPPSLQQLLALPGPDWTSPAFKQLFKSTINQVPIA